LLDGERLRTKTAVNLRLLKQLCGVATERIGHWPQCVGERLPPLQKHTAHDALEHPRVADIYRARAEAEPDHG
jgi:hypothetical protein